MKKTILFLSNHFITLFAFRKELILRLVEDGHQVYICTPRDERNVAFTNMGCQIIETEVQRHGINPIHDGMLMLKYLQIMRRVKPDIIFSYTVKPNIYGCMASKMLGIKQVCNITGTGVTFLSETLTSKIVRILYRMSVKCAHLILFQNIGDRDYFVQHHLVANCNYELIPGSGVNLAHFQIVEMPPDDEIKFIFVGRIMQLKGIDQYLTCAKVVRQRNPNTRFYVAGFCEGEYEAKLEDYQREGWINYVGFQSDIRDWIERCHCVVLPSMGGEGVPNALLEAAAMGRPCIASRVPGSIDVVENMVTGYLFNVGDIDGLITSVYDFIQTSFEIKRKMGEAGRARVETHFDRQIIIERYLREIQ